MSNLTEEQKEQIGAEIDSEGLGYWVQNYGNFEGDDQELKELIQKAKEAVNKLESYLYEQGIMF